MSAEPKLTIAGNNDLATDIARHAISTDAGDPVYLWRSTQDPVVGQSPVIIVADQHERAGFARTALKSGAPVVSLPINTSDETIEQAIIEGRLKLMSRLHGLPALARLAGDCRDRAYGRRYGIFAAHRLPRNFADDIDGALADLIVYVTSLIDSPLVRLGATTSDLGRAGIGAWFVIGRFADDTIATIEVAATLPDAPEPNGELLVEVTGSEAVLRAEPERQSVQVVTSSGIERQPWYAEPQDSLLGYALAKLDQRDATEDVSALHLTQNLEAAASSDERVVPER